MVTKQLNEKWAWLLLFAFLVVMGAVSTAWIDNKFTTDLKLAHTSATQQLQLITSVLSSELNAGQYQNIDGLFREWSKSNVNIAQIQLISNNHFVIAAFARPSSSIHTLELQAPISYSYRDHATVLFRVNLESVYQRQQSFVTQFVGIFLVFSALSSFLMFFALRSQKESSRASRISKLYSALSEINQAIVRMDEEEKLFPLVCRCAVEFGGMSMAWVAQIDEKSTLFFPSTSYGRGLDYLDGIVISSLGNIPEGRGPIGIAYRENRSVIIKDYTTDPLIAPWKRRATGKCWLSAAAFPIPRRGRPFAVLSVYHEQINAFDAEAVALLDEMSRDISFSLDNFDRDAQIKFLAYHDALTELPNRQLAKDHFEMAISFADRANSKMGVLFVDLDNFKAINDTLGHSIGDSLLKVAAKRLDKCVRDTDTLSRQGGDEFLILLADIHDPDAITPIAQKILKQFAVPFEVDGQQLSTSLSIGIAVYPDDGKDFDTLLKKADMAMYQAKEAGRNTYRFFTEQMNVNTLENLRMLNSLRQALESTEFFLHYQPQIDLATGAVIGAEALIRWNHPELGMVPPGNFIPLAEESGLIVQIGDWVLLEACRQTAAWHVAGLPKLVIAVNISAVQFKHHNLENSVLQALVDSGLDPTYLELELTESILIRETEVVLALVRRLKSLGVKLSIDDFGTGYSSLSYLKRFNVDKLKIDQSFIRNMAEDPNDAAIVRAIIQMANALNLKTIAEGVEDEHSLTLLRLHHCDEAQGYYFAKPMPADQFVQYVTQQSPT